MTDVTAYVVIKSQDAASWLLDTPFPNTQGAGYRIEKTPAVTMVLQPPSVAADLQLDPAIPVWLLTLPEAAANACGLV